jgi:3-oxoacyl-[acyl-carrier protein] reductase
MTSPAASQPVALVLGASGTLGGAIARGLASSGYRIALHAHTHPERLPQLDGSTQHKADFRSAAEIDALAKDVLKAHPKIDVVVWCAAIAKDAILANQTEADLREVLAVNLTAPALLAKAFVRQMIKQKDGAWIFLSSHAALSGRAGGAAYAMAQSGLIAFMKSLAREWGPTGIRVNAVVPPFVPESGLGQSASPEFAEVVRKKNVLKATAAKPEDELAKFVVSLAQNKTTSGQVLVTDGRVL